MLQVFAVLSYHYKRQKVGSLASLTVVETVRMLWYRFLLTSGIVRPPRPENNDTGLPAVRLPNNLHSSRNVRQVLQALKAYFVTM